MISPGDHPDLDQLDALLDDARPADDTVARHLAGCQRCQRRLDLLARQGDLLRQLGAVVRRGPWRGPPALERVMERARHQQVALARLLVLAGLRREPRARALLADLPACLPSGDLRATGQRLARRLGSASCPRPPRSDGPGALLPWLRRVDGRSPWWLALGAVAAASRGRSLAALRLARQARMALATAPTDGAGGLEAVCDAVTASVRRRSAGPARQEPRARPSLRHSLAPR